MSNLFDPKEQPNDVSGKITVGLERIAEAFRVLLWEHGKKIGLSPIQIQILIFIHYHENHMCGVSYLAKEFNMAKPTISDAVKSLEKKGLLVKTKDGNDARSQILIVTTKGAEQLKLVESFANPIQSKIEQFTSKEQEQLLLGITSLIYRLNQSGIISVQRTCFACKYYLKENNQQFCSLMNVVLKNKDIRLDCPEFKAKEN